MQSARQSRPKGTRFYKADLHTHTPASGDYETPGVSGEDYVQAALAKGLELIAVTDHNSAEWVDVVRNAAKRTPLHVFPGVEVTTPHCHLLVVFPLDFAKARIDDFLAVIGISGEKRGKQDALGEQPEFVLQKAKECGGIVIAAHANSSNGLLKHPKGQYKQKIFHRDELSALEFTSKQDIEDFCTGRIPGYAAKACVMGSDSHDPAALGRRFTYLKMDGVSLRGIQQALLDYEVRVRFDWNLPVVTHPQILRLTLSQGFFADSPFEFHANLNCFVGGKGVGKSTVVELMRYCFDDVSLIEEIAEDNSGKLSTLLGIGGKVSVEYLDADAQVKLVEREVQQWETERTVRTPEGTPAEILVNPVFFSQGELTRIAASPIAQLDLIDRYLDVESENSDEANLISLLEANATRVQEAVNKVNQATVELEDNETGAKVTRERYAVLEESLKEPILRLFPKWESEKRFLDATEKGLSNVTGEFNQALEQVELDQLFPSSPESTTPCFGLLQQIEKVIDSIRKDFESASRTFKEGIHAKTQQVKALREKWNAEFKKKQKDYENALALLGEQNLRQAQATLRGLRTRLDELEGKQKELDTANKTIRARSSERGELLNRLKSVRGKRFGKRSAKAAEWQQAFNGRIKITVHESANRRAYLDALRTLAKGSMVRETDLKTLTDKIAPTRLIECVIKDNAEYFADQGTMKLETARKLISVVRSRNRQVLLALESVPMTDTPHLEYEVSPDRTKPLHELSVGQKGTVIISLALVEGQAPLVIDQPEEPLDTLAIHEQVVGTLRRQKDVRQFIFTTHNPNVAVGADAELSYVLEASADKGSISASGGIDQETTNRLLLLHLEGGAKALRLRARKYLP